MNIDEYDILNKFIEKLGYNPEQKTEDWYKIRKTTIGGSEIATLLGLNPYNNVKGMIAGKIGLSSFNGNLATRWGNLFEYMTQKWCEIIFKMKAPIIETGSIDGKIEGQRYSPDGLGVVEFLNEDDEKTNYIILFEFKAPFSSLPNKKIPKHYLPQVKTGLFTIPITEYGIFVNNCYRKCKIDDLNFTSNYDRDFHYQDYKKLKNGLEKKTTLACGVIYFYTIKKYKKCIEKIIQRLYDNNELIGIETIPNYNYDDLDRIIILNDKKIDFGISSVNIFSRLLYLLELGIIKCEYSDIKINHNAVNEIQILEEHCIKHSNSNVDLINYHKEKINSKKLIGFLPWKLMISDIIQVEPDDNWGELITPLVNDFINTLKIINNSEHPIEKFYEFYPLNTMIDNDDLDDMMSF